MLNTTLKMIKALITVLFCIALIGVGWAAIPIVQKFVEPSVRDARRLVELEALAARIHESGPSLGLNGEHH